MIIYVISILSKMIYLPETRFEGFVVDLNQID